VQVVGAGAGAGASVQRGRGRVARSASASAGSGGSLSLVLPGLFSLPARATRLQAAAAAARPWRVAFAPRQPGRWTGFHLGVPTALRLSRSQHGFAPGLAGFTKVVPSFADRDLSFQGRLTSRQLPRQAADRFCSIRWLPMTPARRQSQRALSQCAWLRARDACLSGGRGGL